MTVIDLQRNHVGIQSIITQFANYAAAGQGAMLQHTDGYIYCVFARNHRQTIRGRRLYITRSNDNGITWSTAIEISTGNWDDDPAIIQLDTNNVNSDIGVVFNRIPAGTAGSSPTATLTRVAINKETGAANTPYDAITPPNNTDQKWISIVSTSTGFLITCIPRASITTPQVSQYDNSSFTTDNWAYTAKTIFPTNKQPMSLSVKRLSNGHLAMIGAYRTALNGLAAVGNMGNLPAGILRCDAGVSFSSDDGGTWTDVQQITNYTGSPEFDLVGISSVASADLQELSDGQIVVAYQEHTAPQFVSVNTTLKFPATIGIVTDVRYHAEKNAILCGANDATNGGVFIFDLTAQTITRLHTGSEPALWTNVVVSIDINTDGTKLAVGMDNGGINIIDITDADPAEWTIIKELREASTPPLLATIPTANSIYRVKWDVDSSTLLFFSYGDAAHWGGRYDTADTTLVNLQSTHTGGNDRVFVVQSNKIVLVGGSTIQAVDKTTGEASYHTHTTYNNGTIFYDSINDEYVCVTYKPTMTRITDGGSSFTEQGHFTATSDPVWPESGIYEVIEIPGRGVFFTNLDQQGSGMEYHWYSYASKQPAGTRTRYFYLGLGENVNRYGCKWGCGIISNTWMAMPHTAHIIFQNLVNVGRIRYGYFGYNSETKQLVTTDVDFYDVCNIHKVGTNMTTLQFPKFCRDVDDRLYFYFNRWDILQPNGNEFAPVLGIVEPDVKKLTALARIRAIYTRTINSKGRIRKTYTSTLDVRMRIVFAQCIKIKARIVPRQTRTISVLASIKNWKSSSCRVSFSVQKTNITRKLHVLFWVNTGYNRSSSLTVKARVAQTYSCRTTGHFLIRIPASNVNLDFSVLGTYMQILTARARLVHG